MWRKLKNKSNLWETTDKQLTYPAEDIALRSVDKLLHELHLHQIELEMQNEQLRTAQIALEESHEHYIDFYDFAPVGYITLTDNGLISEINLTAATMLGIERSRLLHQRFTKFISSEYENQWHRCLLALQTNDSNQTCELTFRKSKLSGFYAQLDCTRLKKIGAEPQLRIVLTDITERKLEKTALQKSEQHLNQSQAIANIGSWTYDMVDNITWTREMYRIFGVSPDAFTANIKTFISLIHPDDQSSMQSWIACCASGNKPERLGFRCKLADGTIHYIEVQGELLFDDHGQPFQISGTAQDITKCQYVEKRISDLLSFNEEILRKFPAGIAVYKPEGACVMANDSFAKSIGSEVDAMLKQNFRNSEWWQSNGLIDFADQVILSMETIKRDVAGVSCLGNTIALECVIAFIEISGEPHLLVITNDVSVQAQTERELNELNRQLKKKEFAKTRFLAAAGHDLRQPLTAANMFIYALTLTGLTTQQKNLIQHLDISMSTFGGLLDALLNVSKLDAESIVPKYTQVNVSEILIWLEQNFSPLAQEKKLDFRLHYPMQKTLLIRSDIGLVKSVLMNLVSNAIKFTDKGTVLVSARIRGGDVLFQVWDTGIGIPDENKEHIFDEFYQVDNPQRDRTSGLGLGLSIVKRTLMLLKSDIRFRTHSDYGTVFEFYLPLIAASSVASQLNPTMVPHKKIDNNFLAAGKKFIVVEDDMLVAQAMTSCLRKMGGKVNCFRSAEEAMVHSATESADYYIVDHMLGGMLNGIQFLNWLRKKTGKFINAVLVTGDTSGNFIREATGIDWPVLFKPVNVPELLGSLRVLELPPPKID